MLRRIIFIAFIILTIGATAFGYFYLRSAKKPKVDVTSLIPANCDYIIECDNLFSFSKKLTETSLIWEEAKQELYFQQINSSILIIDSLLASDEVAHELFTTTRIYLAGYQQNNNTQLLFAFNLSNLNQEESVITFLKKNAAYFENIDITGASEHVIKITFKNKKNTFYVYNSSGVVLISEHLSLIEQALNKNNSPISADKHFLNLEEDGGNNMDVRIYFRNSYYQTILSPNLFANFPSKSRNEWTALDFTSSPNEFKLNGFIDADSSLFLNALSGQETIETKFISIAPKNTISFISLGISDYQSFCTNLQQQITPQIKENFKTYSKNTEAGLVNEWNLLSAGEFVHLHAKIENETFSFGLLSINDKSQASKLMQQVADTVHHINLNGLEDSTYYFSNKDFFNTLTLNTLHDDFSSAFVISDYIVFAKNDSLLKKYFAELNSYGSLSKSERFLSTQETNLNSESNFYYYSDLSTNYSSSLGLLSPTFIAQLKNPKERLKKFGFAGVQLSAHKGKILTQSCLHYNPVTKQQSLTLWETPLDTSSSFIPQVLINHKTGSKELFAADDKGTIYLVSNTGKIQWKKSLGEKIMSTVYQVDYFKNGKLQMLFNTENYIHLIDRNGNYVTGYPLKLNSPATNGIAVYDYEKTLDYRILIACNDKHIYNYNINGKQVEGFNFPVTEAIVKLKIDFRRINAKDYLIACDNAGNLYGTGRKGELRLSFKNKLNPNCTNYFLDEGKDLNKSKFYFFDFNEIALKQLTLDDKTKTTSVETDMKICNVQYDYINEDKLIDYIVSDESGFAVLDDEGNKLVNYVSKNDIKPGVKTLLFDNQLLFMLIDKNDRLLIVDITGKPSPDQNYFFSSMPIFSSINNDGKPFLIGIYKDKINCYEFKD